MPDVRINQPPRETTVFEAKIEKLRQVALWSRTLFYLNIFTVVVLGVAMVTNPSNLPIKSLDLTAGIPILFFYAGYVLFDFLADVGLIVLSMKRETQYIQTVVKEVQSRR